MVILYGGISLSPKRSQSHHNVICQDYRKTFCNADGSIMGWQASFGFFHAAKSRDESLTFAVQIAFYPPILS
jgi:hypothetical protein